MIDGARAEHSGAFGALRYRDFRWLFVGLVCANVGTWMQSFALGWFVVQLAVLDGKANLGPFYLGLVGLARAVPAFGLGLAGGVLADRLDRRRMLMYTRIAAVAIALLLAAVVLSGLATIGVVMALAFLSAADLAFDGPVRQAIIPNLVERREFFSAIGLARGAMQAATMVGPVLAGFLIVPFGVGGVMVTVALMYFVALLALLPMSPQPVRGARDSSLRESLVEGLTYIRRDPMIGPLTALILVFGSCFASYQQLLPAVAHDTLGVGAVELSWLTAASGVGALVGTYLTAASGAVRRPGVMLLLFMAFSGALLVALGLQRSMGPSIVVLLALGGANTVFAGNHQALLQLYMPDTMRGRVMGMQTTLFSTLGPLGTLVLGSLGSVIGVSSALVVAGACVTVTGLAVLSANRTIRQATLTGARAGAAVAST